MAGTSFSALDLADSARDATCAESAGEVGGGVGVAGKTAPVLADALGGLGVSHCTADGLGGAFAVAAGSKDCAYAAVFCDSASGRTDVESEGVDATGAVVGAAATGCGVVGAFSTTGGAEAVWHPAKASAPKQTPIPAIRRAIMLIHP